MNPYISVFEIYEDNKVLKERMIHLENEIAKLQETNAKQLKEIRILKQKSPYLRAFLLRFIRFKLICN